MRATYQVTGVNASIAVIPQRMRLYFDRVSGSIGEPSAAEKKWPGKNYCLHTGGTEAFVFVIVISRTYVAGRFAN